MYKVIAERMAEFLEGLGYGYIYPADTSQGSCYAVHREIDIMLWELLDLTEYPEFSGNECYPIKAPDDYRGSHDLFNDGYDGATLEADLAEDYFFHTGNLWIGETGIMRRKFCLWCAKQLREECNANPKETD